MILGTTTLFSQQIDSTLVKEISTIKNNIFEQREDVNVLKKQLNNQMSIIKKQNKTLTSLSQVNTRQKESIDSLSNLVNVNSQNITINSNQLGTEIQKVTTERNTQISTLDNTIGQNRLYWILVSLGTLLLGVLMYLFLGKSIKSSKTDIETQIKITNKNIEEESLKLDNKLVNILETQLKLKQAEAKVQPTVNQKEDHSLVLKVADEVTRIQKNLSRMDEKIKGHKHLTKSVKIIKDNFIANGYELVEMLGKDYNEGMKVTANFIPNEDIEIGKQIITRIIKPQVNYNGAMIQAAQIEVSIGE